MQTQKSSGSWRLIAVIRSFFVAPKSDSMDFTVSHLDTATT